MRVCQVNLFYVMPVYRNRFHIGSVGFKYIFINSLVSFCLLVSSQINLV